MTSPRLQRWSRTRVLLVASVSAALTLGGGPAASAASPPTPTPSHSPSAGTPSSAPAGSVSWSAQPSSAQGPDRRSAFRYTNLKPGTVVSDYVAVTNFSKVPVTFQMYATDAFTTSTGSLDMLAAKTAPTDIGSWIKMSKPVITLAPDARVNEPFTLTIPGTASPGDHTGGIIAAVAVTATGANGAKVTVDRRLAVPIFLRVTGPLRSEVTVESLTVGGYRGTVNPFGAGASTVAYTIHNTGNVRLNIGQTVSVTGPFGVSVTSTSPKPISDLLPGQSVRVTRPVTGVFPAGPLTLHVHLTPTESKNIPASGAVAHVLSRTVSLWAPPWPQLLVLLLLIGLGFAIRWRRKRAKRRIENAVAQARRETVEELASTGADAK